MIPLLPIWIDIDSIFSKYRDIDRQKAYQILLSRATHSARSRHRATVTLPGVGCPLSGLAEIALKLVMQRIRRTIRRWRSITGRSFVELGPQWQRLIGLYWSRRNRGLVSLLTRTSGAFHRSYSGIHSTLTLFVWIECYHLKVRIDGCGVAKHSSSSAKTSPNLKDCTQLIIQGTSCELLRCWIPSCWIAYGFESSLKVSPTARLQYWSWLTEQYTTACQTDHSSRRRRDYVTDN